MSRTKISTTIYITPEQSDRLKLLHERTKVPVSVYIREGIDMVLKHYEHVLPGQMSLGASSTSTTPAPPPVASRRAEATTDGTPRPTLRTGAAAHSTAAHGTPEAAPSTSGHHGSRSGEGNG